MSVPAGCAICSQLSGDATNDLIATLLPHQSYVRRVMFESAAFAGIPSLGPLAPGHSLLCPKNHVTSLAQLDREQDSEYAQTYTELANALRTTYGLDVFSFEHGMAAKGGRILCTVDHAHVHLVPLPAAVIAELADDPGWTVVDDSVDALRDATAGREYVWWRTPDGRARVRVVGGEQVSSQFMRRRIAAAAGSSHWDWRVVPAPDDTDAAWRRLTAAEAGA